ncbi:dihydrodipicolinate synthase family protein [Leucobacter sp. CSA2]|uniref:Dihydrodipicolinate synthase family protein n=1 Tax=Leucobacter edaphi TaxID=2796472 RepID=A0A934QB10_9MICO|nr:dihydrodipicolinate synthase family protein [Leucobacter edaphi]MBK0421088.1 dihydrodipicolinate synthase family protein [Leucobacter edaphi]
MSTDFLRGLSAFPLTPLRDEELDDQAAARIMIRLRDAGVDSITVLGSTGSGPYLSRDERLRALEIGTRHAGEVPVIAGVAALRTRDAVRNARDAAAAGARAVLLAPLQYQALSDDEVYGLFADVAEGSELPIVLYDNPGTTRFTFSDELLARIGEIPAVAAVKVPPLPSTRAEKERRLAELRGMLPAGTIVGLSGDASAADGLLAGADAWYSVIAGTLPEAAIRIARAAFAGDEVAAREADARMGGLWEANAAYGSLRVVAAVAEELGLAGPNSLPRPVRGLEGEAKQRVLAWLRSHSGEATA